jgi:hypothetical protein
MLEETPSAMNMEPASCHGLWRLWLTEISSHSIPSEELALHPSGGARWSVTYGYNQESNPTLQWRLDDEGCLLATFRGRSM